LLGGEFLIFWLVFVKKVVYAENVMKRYQIYLDETQVAKLRRLAKRSGVRSTSALIRIFIENGLNKGNEK